MKNNEDEILIEKNIISNKTLINSGRFIKKPLIGSQGNGIEIINDF